MGYARAGPPWTEYDGTRSYWVDTLVLPAWHGHEVVATVLCEIARGRGAVEQFGVVKEWRRRGIGKAILVRALRSLEKQGLPTVRVHTTTDNAYGSRRLYESVGFRLVKQQGFYRKQVGWKSPSSLPPSEGALV